MARITYTAKRELKAGHIEDEEYTLDFDAQQINESNDPEARQHVAKSGKRETVFVRYEKAWNIESDQIDPEVATATYGTAFPISGAGDPAMAPLSTTEIAYYDHTLGLLRLIRFNTQSLAWTFIGAGQSIGTTTSPAMCVLNSTDVAIANANTDVLQTWRVNLTTGAWSQVGNDFDLAAGLGANVGVCALAKLTSTVIAFYDTTNEKLAAITFDGTDWTITGSTLAIAGTGNPALATQTESLIAFVDTTLDSLRRYSWSGSAWSLVGSGLSVSGIGGNCALAPLSDQLVVLMDATVEGLRVFGWDDETQVYYPVDVNLNVTITGAGNPALAALTDTDIVFFDSLLESLQIYRFPVFVGDIASWDEFAASVAGGEAFTLDPYGTSDEEDNPLNVKMVGRVTKTRVNSTRRMVYSFNAIEQE